MMDVELKKRWVKALRSGKYRQGHGKLCFNDNYCCLGVLADIEGALVALDDYTYNIKGIIDESIWGCPYPTTSLPPISFLNKVGLSSSVSYKLADMNDSGKTFNKIADWIEENL